jgi:predicted glycosyltransferase
MRVLFVPVSAPRGFGEYARAREIARAVQHRWPDAQLHFVLSAQAPYAADCPFPATLLPGSATLHTPQVVALLKSFQPHLVIFDNAGRTAQIRAAHAGGARVVYVSSRRRQRRKAFRLSWMRLLNEHWIAYPSFIAGEPGWWEKLKLRMLGRPRVRFVDTVLPTSPAVAPVTGTDFVLVVPGGGTAHPGARAAPQIISEAAAGLARRGIRTVLAGVADAADRAAAPTEATLLTRLPLLPQPQLIDLLRRARIVVSNGGDTLLQALACGCACVAVPIAHDQAARIARCGELGLVRQSPLLASAIVDAVAALDRDEVQRQSLIARGRAAGVRDAMPQILEWLAALLAAESRP